jgi:ubiquinone/menaquinone biosynthesis C-methylase UbiE
MTEWYSTVGELNAFQGTVTLLSMAKASQCNTVLEVACGTGTHSEIIAMSYLKKGGVLVSCDFSKDMVAGASKRF